MSLWDRTSENDKQWSKPTAPSLQSREDLTHGELPGYTQEYNQPYSNQYASNPAARQDAWCEMGTETQQPTWHTNTGTSPMEMDTPYVQGTERAMADFSEKSLRHGFIRKVFAILAAQLLVTFAVIALFVTVKPVKQFVQANSWVLIAASITTVVLVIVLACGEKLRRKFPQNLICLAIFTLAEAWLLGAVSSQFDVDEVMMAVGICAGVTTVMFLFGLQSKFDFTYLNGILVVLTFCLLGFGILCLIIQDRYLQLIYASLGALLFSMWIVIDVQLVVGKGKYSWNSEEHILAALNIYLDIINLFLFILQIIKGTSD